jgi:tetratricopeptide (TPR) repeat protein
MNKLYITLLTILLSFPTISAFADNVSFRATAPSIVEVGERFRVQYTINSQDVSNFSYPKFDGFDVMYGPSTSQQSSFQYINGQMSQSSSYTYTFTLMATKVGTYTIPAATINVGGQPYKSQSLKIQVVAASGNRQSQQSQQQGMRRQRQQDEPSRPQSTTISASDLFMTATASRTKMYEQEAVLVTYKVYSLVNLTQLDGKLPTLDGFQIQEIPLPRNKEFELENYNGRVYHTVVWSQYVLFPQKTGDLVIPSITYEGVVVQQNRYIDPIEAFFNGTGGVVEVKKKITTPQLTIHVSPLPDKPANFSGAVGSFSLSSNISTQQVKANDAITLKIAVKGTGNMKLISAPEVAFPKDFETYDAKATDNFSLTRNGLSGTKEFEYLAVPRHAGTYTIPAAEFVYFNPATHSYQTLTTEPYTIEVEKGSGSSSSVADYTSNQQDVRELNKDIRYIKTGNTTLHRPGDNFFGSWKYWLAYLIPLLVFFVILAVGHKRIKDNANIAKMRGRNANKIAKKRLKVAAKLLAAHNQNEFYDEVMRALWGYIADKLNMPQANLNKDNINAALAQQQVEPSLIEQFIKTLNECEFARYAPGNPNENMETVYNNAVNVISQIEGNFKKVPQKPQQATLSLLLCALLSITASLSAEAQGTSTLRQAQGKTDSAQIKQQADSLYAQEHYREAVKIYEAILEHQGVSKDIYYNLGNCYYKLDEVALSVLNYERALLLDPSDSDTKANLALARGKTADKVTPPSEMFFVTWWRTLTNAMSINSWLIIAFVAFVLMLGFWVAFAFKSDILWRKIGFYGAILALFITIVANLCALSQHLTIVNRHYAIIIGSAVTVKSSPSDSSTDLFIIHEGAKVEILDQTMQEWREVKLEEGKVGWIPVGELEQI